VPCRALVPDEPVRHRQPGDARGSRDSRAGRARLHPVVTGGGRRGGGCTAAPNPLVACWHYDRGPQRGVNFRLRAALGAPESWPGPATASCGRT